MDTGEAGWPGQLVASHAVAVHKIGHAPVFHPNLVASTAKVKGARQTTVKYNRVQVLYIQ